jgi:hypothetical protein
MALIKKREDTKYPGIKLLTYVSGAQAWDIHVIHNGKRKTKRLSKPPYKQEDAYNWQLEQSDKLRRNKSGYDHSLYDRTPVSKLMEVYLNGGELNGKTIRGRLNIDDEPIGISNTGYVERFIKWLKANGDPSLDALIKRLPKILFNTLKTVLTSGKDGQDHQDQQQT